MNKTSILIVLILVVIAGGIMWSSRKPTTPPAEPPEIEPLEKGEVIKTKKGDHFSLVLEANPTTGYQWELDFDSSFIQLVERNYAPPSQSLVGAGGEETFNFLALKSGETEIIFSYLRPWEKEEVEKLVYKIIIN